MTTVARIRTAVSPLPIAVLLLAILLLPSTPGAYAQDETAIGVDATTDNNTATSLGSIDSCVSVEKGDTFDVDVFIINVTDLLAWEAYMAYDNAVVQVVDRDVDMFQAVDPGSSVFNTSESVPPNEDGLFRVGGTDLIDPPVGDSGSGVLARLTLEALAEGRTSLSIEPHDLDEDGQPDIGPTLADVDGARIGDADGDSFFDGTNFVAEVVVDGDCTDVVSTPISAPASETVNSGGDGGWRWWMTALVAVAAGATLLVGTVYRLSRSRQRRSAGAGDE